MDERLLSSIVSFEGRENVPITGDLQEVKISVIQKC